MTSDLLFDDSFPVKTGISPTGIVDPLLDTRLTPGYSRFYSTNGNRPGIQSYTLLSPVFLDFRDHLWPEIFEIVVWAQLLKLLKLTINNF